MAPVVDLEGAVTGERLEAELARCVGPPDVPVGRRDRLMVLLLLLTGWPIRVWRCGAV